MLACRDSFRKGSSVFLQKLKGGTTRGPSLGKKEAVTRPRDNRGGNKFLKEREGKVGTSVGLRGLAKESAARGLFGGGPT